MPQKISRLFRPCDLYAALLIFLFFLLFFFLGYTRHYGFLTSINDMGHYDQAIWGITRKGYLLNTSQFNFPINKLGFHFDPVLYLFSPLYYVKPTVNWLIMAQAMALSVSAWPIYRLACLYAPTGKTGILWGLAYLVNPFLLNAATWDFHPLTLAVPFVAAACLAVERQRYYSLLSCCLFILLCKEHFGLMVAGFGILWAVRYRSWKSLFLILLGAFHFFIVFHYIMPSFSPTGSHVMISDHLGQLSRYSWLGNSVSEIIKTLLKHPQQVMHTALFKHTGFLYLGLLFLPFLGLPLTGILYIFPAWGDLLVNILSANPLPRGVYAYHSAAILPLFCAAAISGGHKFLQRCKVITYSQLAGIILLVSLINGYTLTTLPLPSTYNFWGPKKLINHKDALLEKIHEVIGTEASLSAQANIGPHLAQREEIFSFPNKIGETNAIALRLASPTTRLSPMNPGETGTWASHLQMEPEIYLQTISNLLGDPNYGIAMWQDPWLVLKQGEPDCCSRKLIATKLSTLKNDWALK